MTFYLLKYNNVLPVIYCINVAEKYDRRIKDYIKASKRRDASKRGRALSLAIAFIFEERESP